MTLNMYWLHPNFFLYYDNWFFFFFQVGEMVHNLWKTRSFLWPLCAGNVVRRSLHFYIIIFHPWPITSFFINLPTLSLHFSFIHVFIQNPSILARITVPGVKRLWLQPERVMHKWPTYFVKLLIIGEYCWELMWLLPDLRPRLRLLFALSIAIACRLSCSLRRFLADFWI